MDSKKYELLIKSLTVSVNTMRKCWETDIQSFETLNKIQYQQDKETLKNIKDLKEKYEKYMDAKEKEIESLNKWCNYWQESFLTLEKSKEDIIKEKNKEIKSLKAKLSCYGIKYSKNKRK